MITEKEARELARGLSLITCEERCWYEDTYTVYETNWSEIVKLIERVKDQNNA